MHELFVAVLTFHGPSAAAGLTGQQKQILEYGRAEQIDSFSKAPYRRTLPDTNSG